jgi:hypothetical protein
MTNDGEKRMHGLGWMIEFWEDSGLSLLTYPGRSELIGITRWRNSHLFRMILFR